MRKIFLIFMLIISLNGNALNTKTPTLTSGWYLWDPYQYTETSSTGQSILTGLDIKLISAIFENMGYKIKYEPVDWDTHQKDIKTGRRDIAAGAFYSPDRAAYAYYSAPYRDETDVLFIRKGDKKNLKFNNFTTMLNFLKKKNLKIGVVAGYKYAFPELNNLINNPQNKNLFLAVPTEKDNFQNLFSKKIVGFFSGRLAGATVAWRNKWQAFIETHPSFLLNGKIYVLFSKKTTSPQLVEQFNRSLNQLKADGRYKNIVMKYAHPVLLAITIERPWFLTLDIIGVIAFALSGLILAHQEEYSIIGAFVLAALPAVGGGILRDVLINRHPLGFLNTATYLITIFVLLIIVYFIIHFYNALRKHVPLIRKYDQKINFMKLSDRYVAIFDSLGLSAFTVIGVVITVDADLQPLLLWGPLFAVVTSIGGGILRDLVRNDSHIRFLKGELYAEISALWGFLLCLYLNWDIYNLDPSATFNAVLITLLGCFTCRLLIIYFKIKSINY